MSELGDQALDRAEAKRGLIAFTRRAWPILEPGAPYIHGWHGDAIAEHLEATLDGRLTRLLINIPPGTAKSTYISVLFPAWVWTFRPQARFLSASHELGLALRDNRKSRLLISSPWYQTRWPVALAPDQNEKAYFENAARGFRQAAAFASLTGKRADWLLIDDPQSPELAYSATHREASLRIFDETLPSRLNDPEKSVIIVIMQRLHERDISGHILQRELGYEHLCLPMEFEPERRCTTSIGWRDPREYAGELLFPERFPRTVVMRDQKALGSFASAGQLQQRPAPREGGMFQRAWLKSLPAVPAGTRWVRGWDLAASTAKTAAYTAGVKLGQAPDGRFVIAHVVRERASAAGVEHLLLTTAQSDGPHVQGSLPQDPGQAGKAQAARFIKMLAGYPYRASPETGDKQTRAAPLSAQAEAGNLYLMPGPWREAFIEELTAFPNGAFADQVDAASRAFMELIEAGRVEGMLFKKAQRQR